MWLGAQNGWLVLLESHDIEKHTLPTFFFYSSHKQIAFLSSVTLWRIPQMFACVLFVPSRLYVHSAVGNWKKCLHSIKLKDSVLSLV